MIDRVELIRVAQTRIGSPYLLGAKWNLKDGNPKGPIDCSGFVRWCYAQIGILIPDGSTEQYLGCTKVKSPLLGDLGFFRVDGKVNVMHHVGMILDDKNVIEARGKMLDQQGLDVGEHVLLRPRIRWELWKDFVGWMRPNEVLNIEDNKGAA